ncbi:MAG: glycosyltransferase family 4 protein [Nanoarchaeota archaeon]
MNILFVSEYFYPKLAGGEIWSSDLCRGLIKKGHKITVITSRYNKNLKKKEIIGGIKVLRIAQTGEIIKRINFAIRLFLFLNKLLNKEKFDVVHSMSYVASVPASWIAKRYKISSITSVHSYFGRDWFKFENLVKARFNYLIERVILKLDRSDVIHVPSKHLANLISKIKPNVKIIPNFIVKENMDKLDKTEIIKIKTELKIKPDTKLLIFIGSLTKIKNILNLVKIIKIPEGFHLLIVGEGSLRKEIIKVIKERNLEDKITLLKSKDHLATMRYLQLSSVLINPSISESFGLTVIEALYFNKLVISTNVGIVKELNEGNIIKINSLEEINELLQNNIKKSKIKQFDETFLVDNVIEKFEDIYT